MKSLQRILCRLFFLVSLAAYAIQVSAQSIPVPNAPHSDPGLAKVVASGTVPDAATKETILSKLQQVYGSDKVIDQISVGGVTAPPHWAAGVSGLVTPQLKTVHRGQLAIDGTNVSIHGEVANEAARQTIANTFGSALHAQFSVKNALRVTAASQSAIDQALANRVIEFENASALLTAAGKEILDELAETLKTVAAKRIDVIGHTDNVGTPSRNLALSRARADSVKIYLVLKGVPPESMSVTGMGADQPLMANTTEEGRRRNRRIEFRVSQ